MLAIEEIQRRLVEKSDRLWSKVSRRGPNECWPWIADAVSDFGYGVLKIPNSRKNILAHNAAYLVTNGLILDGQVIRHTCDNPPCCNPAHLIPGDHLANVRDMWERGRMGDTRNFGAANGRARVTAEQVRDIRHRDLSIKQIMAEFGYSKAQAWRIRSGKHWPEIT